MRGGVSSLLVVWALGCGGKAGDSAPFIYGDDAADCGGDVTAVAPGTRVACSTGDCQLEVVQTDPAPPDRGDNTWTLQVLSPDGAALDLSALNVEPFMPAHDHGTVPASFSGAKNGDGWSVGPFDLFMPGRWELRVSGVQADGSDMAAVVAFCVEG